MEKVNNYRLLRDRDYLFSATSGIFFLIVSLFINYLAGVYSMERASNFVTDIILSNIPVFDVDFIFVYSTVALFVFIGVLCAFRLERIPFIAKSIALFVIIRSMLFLLLLASITSLFIFLKKTIKYF